MNMNLLPIKTFKTVVYSHMLLTRLQISPDFKFCTLAQNILLNAILIVNSHIIYVKT